MLFFLIFALEMLSLEILVAFNREVQLFQYLLAFMIAYVNAINPSNQNINSTIVMIIYILVVVMLDNSMYTIDIKYKYLIISLFIWFVSLQRYKSYQVKNDKYNKDNVILLFYKPKKFRDHLISLFGNDTGTMSVVCGNKWAKFRWKSKYICITSFNEEKIKNDYFVIDTGVKITEDIQHKFYAIKNTPARTAQSFYLRLNCVRAFKPLLNEMGEKWSYKFGDFLPSFYLFRRKLYK